MALAALPLALILTFSGTAWPQEAEVVEVPAGAAADPGPAGLVPSGVFIDEAESNDTAATAQPLPSLPVRVRGFLYRAPFVAGDIDEDVFSFTAAAGDRVYAATMTSWSSGSTDSELDILDVDGTTVLETDDNNGTASTTSSSIAGTLLVTGGTYYVRVRQGTVTSLTGTHRPYDLYVQLQTGTPTAEVEPTPNPLPANGWMSGAVDPLAESDTFTLTVNAGDTIVAILDLDPERDAPDWNGRLGIGNFNNFFFVTGDTPVAADTAPSEALFMTVKTTGTYIIYVQEQVSGTGGGPAATWHLSVFVSPARPRSCTTYAGTAGPIADLGTTDFTVAVPDPRSVGYLRLTLNATHPDTDNLDVTLIGPEGNEMILFDDRTTNAGAAAPQINFTLEDEGAIPSSIFSVYSGMHFAPEVGGRFEYFNGMPAQGTWTLRVRDDTVAAVGNVNSWSLDVCDPDPRPACLDPGPGEVTLFATDFESGDAGFTHSGVQDEWERGLPAFAPITTAHSGTNAFKTDLDGTYNASANFDLVSPPISLPLVSGRLTLDWWQKFQMDTASSDTYWVEVRQVGVPANARRVFSWTGSVMTRSVGSPATTIPQSAGWGLVQADVSDFAGQDVEVVYHLASSTATQLAGVAVDDVRVSSCTTVTGQLLSNVGITKSDGQGTYFPGEVLTYTLVASNAGPAAVVAARVRDTFPADLTNVSWSCTASAGSACGSAGGTGDIDVLVDLLAGGTATFTVTATVDPGATGPIANTATITVPATHSDPAPGDNSATDTNVLAAAAAEAIEVDPTGNRVYEPNETVTLAPTWRNTAANAVTLVGTLDNHIGPPGATYTIPDDSASYGTVAAGDASSCTSTGDCYSVRNDAATRPTTHWDSTVDESMSPTGTTKTWTLHIGESFTDVPASNPFYRFIETLLHNGVTGGCTATEYCPGASTSREQMAVFALVAKEGLGYAPPDCVPPNAFNDVPETSPFCRWIEELAGRGVVAGCGGGNYCPAEAVTREQMAVFMLRTLDPALNPPFCAPPNLFADVPETSAFCRWIEELANRGVVTGCGGGNYCPTDPVTREQMGVFISVTFGLTLYGL
jgi:uncharacterized repeat protein (TIGR01451 family)